jgi:hypothetical protein
MGAPNGLFYDLLPAVSVNGAVGTAVQSSRFTQTPAPYSLIFRPLRQTGTLTVSGLLDLVCSHIMANANSASWLAGRTIHQAQKVFGVLPIVFAGDGIDVVGRPCEGAIIVVFPLPLALIIGRGLLAGLCRSCVARDVRARTIAAVRVTLRYHF